MVEDIIDKGITLNYLLTYLRTKNPANLKVCSLLDKRARRLVDVPVEYVGFYIPDEFVVGYGLDYLERYRTLPFIGIIKPEDKEAAQQPPKVRPAKENAPSNLGQLRYTPPRHTFGLASAVREAFPTRPPCAQLKFPDAHYIRPALNRLLRKRCSLLCAPSDGAILSETS